MWSIIENIRKTLKYKVYDHFKNLFTSDRAWKLVFIVDSRI